MGKIKGCGNESCEAHKKKLKSKESEAFCSKCGRPLVYVCKDCYTQLPADTDKYCVRCLAKRKDKLWKVFKDTAKVGGGTLTLGSVILYGKKAFDWVKKIKG
ncbi:MAG: hypothetical protein ACTSQ8_24640 [Candidatus Helarchaeota archaeon]